jgi:hypothetical protein
MIALTLGFALLQGLVLLQPTDAFPEQVIEPEAAARTFLATCWRGLRSPERFHAAIEASPLHFAPAPTRHDGQRYRSERADIHFVLQRAFDRPVCTMSIRLASEEETTRFIDRLTEKLGLAAPERATMLDVGTTLYNWRDIPIDDRAYYLNAEADIPLDGRRPVTLEILLSFENRMGVPAE